MRCIMVLTWRLDFGSEDWIIRNTSFNHNEWGWWEIPIPMPVLVS
jgi:hypothetical protein